MASNFQVKIYLQWIHKLAGKHFTGKKNVSWLVIINVQAEILFCSKFFQIYFYKRSASQLPHHM